MVFSILRVWHFTISFCMLYITYLLSDPHTCMKMKPADPLGWYKHPHCCIFHLIFLKYLNSSAPCCKIIFEWVLEHTYKKLPFGNRSYHVSHFSISSSDPYSCMPCSHSWAVYSLVKCDWIADEYRCSPGSELPKKYDWGGGGGQKVLKNAYI